MMGINFNVNRIENATILGFKPMVGIAFYHIQLLYGYNFFKSSDETTAILGHNRFTARIAIPIAKLSKKTGFWRYRYKKDDEYDY